MCSSINSDEYFRMKLQWKSVSKEQEKETQGYEIIEALLVCI